MNGLSQAIVCGLCLVCSGFPDVTSAQEARAKQSLPVSIYAVAPIARTDNPAMTTAAAPTPTTPSGKLPQYLLEQPFPGIDPAASNTDGSLIACQLHLPDKVLRLEIQVTVDGQPFSQVRQQRVNSLWKALSSASAVTTDEGAAPISAEDLANGQAGEPPLLGRLRRYCQATGRLPSPQEIDWWLTHVVDGPCCLWLNDHFQRVRGEQQPEYLVLDLDHDGIISAGELAVSVETLQRCDLNRNDIIEWTEIATAARNENPTPGSTTIASAMTLAKPSATPPDLRVKIGFHTADPAQSRLTVEAIAAELESAVTQAKVTPSGLRLTLYDTPVFLQAIQSNEANIDQLSVGAVYDGYPWLPDLDPYDDGRITLRERSQILERLLRQDRNQDGQLTRNEAVSPLRVCVAWGPIVHRELANLRRINLPTTTMLAASPGWFDRMDRNRDRDLTRGEFPGTDEQFSAMDRDHDHLISVEEANAFDATDSVKAPLDVPRPLSDAPALPE
ncbi:hypothetical protein GC163_01135 [bacterium]|nr:hypothetical protein [bacterium]